MPFCLHDAVVTPLEKSLANLAELLRKAKAVSAEGAMSEADILEARIAPDMLPSAYQVDPARAHSAGVIAALSRGTFNPSLDFPE